MAVKVEVPTAGGCFKISSIETCGSMSVKSCKARGEAPRPGKFAAAKDAVGGDEVDGNGAADVDDNSGTLRIAEAVSGHGAGEAVDADMIGACDGGGDGEIGIGQRAEGPFLADPFGELRPRDGSRWRATRVCLGANLSASD